MRPTRTRHQPPGAACPALRGRRRGWPFSGQPGVRPAVSHPALGSPPGRRRSGTPLLTGGRGPRHQVCSRPPWPGRRRRRYRRRTSAAPTAVPERTPHGLLCGHPPPRRPPPAPVSGPARHAPDPHSPRICAGAGPGGPRRGRWRPPAHAGQDQLRGRPAAGRVMPHLIAQPRSHRLCEKELLRRRADRTRSRAHCSTRTFAGGTSGRGEVSSSA